MSMVKCRFCPTWHPGADERYWHGCEGKDAHLADVEAQLTTARSALGCIPLKAMSIVGPPYDVAFSVEAFRELFAAADALAAETENDSLVEHAEDGR